MSLSSSSFVELPLKPRWLYRLFLSSVALVALAGCAEGTKIAMAAALGRSTRISEVKKGLALDPDNPALHNRLGQLYADTTGWSNLATGVASFAFGNFNGLEALTYVRTNGSKFYSVDGHDVIAGTP